MELLQLRYDEMTSFLWRVYRKGEYYTDALFRHLYSTGNLDLKEAPAFSANPGFAETLMEDCGFSLPGVKEIYREGDTTKFTLDFDPRIACESVLIPMRFYHTLCVSSQLGCRWNCRFCETGQLGLKRNLQAKEIVAQILTARFQLGADTLRNLVFMGMGEPLENLEEVLRTVDIVSDPRGLNIPAKYISLSTAGHIPGIRELSRLCREYPRKNYHKLHLSLSLHSADPETRDRIMPINRAYPLSELKDALLQSSYSKVKDGLYIEYMILPGVNDTEDQIDKFLFFLEGMEVKINLIPYNPGSNPLFRKPEQEEVDRLWDSLKRRGYQCRTRHSRGETVMAACGQLGRNTPENCIKREQN